MRILTPFLYAGAFAVAIYAAVSQTSLPTAEASNPASVVSATPTDLIAPPPVARVGKRETCRAQVTSKKLKRLEARDAMQVCVAQARLDCLNQAIALKHRGTARRVYIKSCVAA